MREKVGSGIENLVGKQEDIVPYVGGLYSLSYPEVEDVSPEFWKSRLQSAVKAILSALANKAPTIVMSVPERLQFFEICLTYLIYEDSIFYAPAKIMIKIKSYFVRSKASSTPKAPFYIDPLWWLAANYRLFFFSIKSPIDKAFCF